MNGTEHIPASQEESHTLGPWHSNAPCQTWQHNFNLWTRPVHTAAAGIGFTVAGRTREECEANAAMVSAAPDLLAALRECLAIVALQNGNLHADTNAIQDRARAAIARATGGGE